MVVYDRDGYDLATDIGGKNDCFQGFLYYKHLCDVFSYKRCAIVLLRGIKKLCIWYGARKIMLGIFHSHVYLRWWQQAHDLPFGQFSVSKTNMLLP